MNIKLFLVLVILGSSASLKAQVDVAEPTTQIAVEEKEDAEKDNTATPNPFNKPLELPDFKPEKGDAETLDLPVNSSAIELDYERREGFDLTEQSTLINPGVIFEKRWEDKRKKIALADREGDFRKNLNLGSYNTGSAKVDVVYRDHQVFDGDRIRIFVNDDVIKPNILLTNSYGGFNLNLQPGINKIDFLALNQGESGPNTAYLAVYDEEGNLVSANEWNLATGFKATIIVVKK